MRIDLRKAFLSLVLAGAAGGLLLLPTISFIGSMLAPTQPALPTTHVPQLVGDALWASMNGGRATALQPINPFTVARFMSCNAVAEFAPDSAADRDRRQEECLTLLPAIEAVGLVSNTHLKSEGVWQDPRVPFVSLATMNNVANRWSRSQLLDALAERAEFSFGFTGVEQASRGFFNQSASELALPQAALLAGLLRERHLDPWCGPVRSTQVRRRILAKMRDNLAIDEAAYQAADVSALGLNADPPPNRKPCE